MKRVAINGFGRIGRLVYRVAALQGNWDIVAINDIVPADNLAYLLKYDSTHGRFPGTVDVEGQAIIVNGKKTAVFSEKDPQRLPWKDLQVDTVIEATGFFTSLEAAGNHLKAGACQVVITAPGTNGVPTFVMGVNHENYDPEKDRIVSNASCTTNCLAPLAKILLDNFGIDEGLMTTVHSVTSSQPTVDGPSRKDWRGGRGAGQNIIPASTGAAKAVVECLPEIKGKLTGMALRIPTADVSVVDLTVRLTKSATFEQICQILKAASLGAYKGILAYSDELLVSSDFIGSPFSAIFDQYASIALNDRFFKFILWYDNEMGYSCRVVDLVNYMTTRREDVRKS